MAVSVCFPYRPDGAHRDRLAEWVTEWWRTTFPTFELHVGRSDMGPFNRSAAINEAVQQSTGEILIVADLDVISPKQFVEEAIQRVEKDPTAWGFTFENYIKFTERFTARLLDQGSTDIPLDDIDYYEWSKSTMSGLLVVSRDGFNTVGGFDDGFRGWGFEDVGFAHIADKSLSPHFRIRDGSAYHLWHEPAVVDRNQLAENQIRYEQKYLGIWQPTPDILSEGREGEEYPPRQMYVRNRIPPCVWTATGLPAGLEIDRDGELAGTPLRAETTTIVITATDAEGVAASRTYPNFKIGRSRQKAGNRSVGVYIGWDEPFDHLMDRLRWATPALKADNCYKTLHFIEPDSEPHGFALVFNAALRKPDPGPERTYVLIFEPPEIIGEKHPWLTTEHPQFGANIFMFGEGSIHRQVLGLHIPQATLSPSDIIPSTKPSRCSMICSDSNVTPYHKKRREVLAALRDTDLDIDFYGRHMRTDPADPRVKGEIVGEIKDAALRPYTFTIDFENTERDVLTDKFIDPILNGTVPITNSTGAAKVFPTESFEYVNFDLTVPQIVERIARIITTEDLQRYDRPICRSRRLASAGPVNICEWMYRRVENR